MRVLIIGENRAAAVAIRNVLRYAPGFEFVALVHGRAPCGALASERGAELLLFGELPEDLRRQRVAESRRAVPEAKLVVLVDTADPDELSDLLADGVDAVVSTGVGPPAIGLLIRAVAQGHVIHPAPAWARRTSTSDGLTSRQLQILRLAASGTPNGEIACELGVSQQTVKYHLTNIYRKLGLANRTAAAHYAHSCALV